MPDLRILPPPAFADASAAARWLDADAPLICAALRAAQVIAATPAERVAVGAALADLGALVEHAAQVAAGAAGPASTWPALDAGGGEGRAQLAVVVALGLHACVNAAAADPEALPEVRTVGGLALLARMLEARIRDETTTMQESTMPTYTAESGRPYGHVPGHSYLDALVTLRGDDMRGWRCRVTFKRGSAQGYDEEHANASCMGVGATAAEAVEKARALARGVMADGAWAPEVGSYLETALADALDQAESETPA